MCCKRKIISIISEGTLFKCSCGFYYLNFKNIFLQFNEKELRSFKSYLFNLSKTCFINEKKGYELDRCISIPTFQPNLALVFSKKEFLNLKILLSHKKLNRIIKYDEIENMISEN